MERFDFDWVLDDFFLFYEIDLDKKLDLIC